MASLNMKGSLLQTSCGSPHYASPQVVQVITLDAFLVCSRLFLCVLIRISKHSILDTSRRAQNTMVCNLIFGAVVSFYMR
jgi:hypothetical protein